MFPIPKDAQTAKTAKHTPSVFPSHLVLKPLSSVYIGPPAISPLSLVTRYLTASRDSAYFVERPKSAEIHIQTIAPGPPATMAVATPTMFPVPMVAASAVIRDWKGEMSPFDTSSWLSLFEKTSLIANPKLRHGRNFSLMVRYTPVPTKNTNMTGPQTKLLTAERISAKLNPLIFSPS